MQQRVGVLIAPAGLVRLSVCPSEDASRLPESEPSRACRSTAFCLQADPEGWQSKRAAALTGTWIREERREERRTEEGRNNTQGGEAKERKAPIPLERKQHLGCVIECTKDIGAEETLLFCCLNVRL